MMIPCVGVAATSMGAPTWTSDRAPVYGPERLSRDDRELSDPAGVQSDKAWPGWEPYVGLVCLDGDG